jgi:pacifastin inhibitor LCMII
MKMSSTKTTCGRIATLGLLVGLMLALTNQSQSSCNPEPVEAICVYDGMTYEIGDSFPADDGCNTCSCDADGSVACTEMACGCDYAGTWYDQGESFWATDGCNQCTCMGEGVACTKMWCACTGEEWFRDYMATSPDMCAVIKFTCPASTAYFINECGCGCQQSPNCETVYDCEPPTNCDDEMAACPYSTFAL